MTKIGFSSEKVLLVEVSRGEANGGACPPPFPQFSLLTKQGPPLSALNIRDIAFCGCLKITQTRNSEVDNFTLELLKRSDS